MQIIAGETHSCCRDSAHSWSQDSAGLGKVAPEAPKHDGHFRPSSCSPHSFERIRRPLLGAQSSNKPPGLPTTHPPPPPRLLRQLVGTVWFSWLERCWERGLPWCSVLAQRFLALCQPPSGTLMAAVVLLASSIQTRSPCLSLSFFQSLSPQLSQGLCGKAWAYPLWKRLSKPCLPLQPLESTVSRPCEGDWTGAGDYLHSLGRVAKCFWVSPGTVLISEHPKLRSLPSETIVKSTGSRTNADVQHGWVPARKEQGFTFSCSIKTLPVYTTLVLPT